MPIVLSRIAEERSRELFFLAIAALALSAALVSEYMGLSLALGAFIAGLVVSESDLSHRVLGELLPTRDVFAVLFFVSAGMLIDPAVVSDEWAVIVVSLILILIVRAAASRALLGRVTRAHTATLAAVALLPAGEFSFVLARSGLDEGAISESIFGAIIAATAITIMVSPPALAGAYRWMERETAPRRTDAAEPIEAPSRLGRHAVICGYDAVGRVVASLLSPRFESLIVEDNPRAARSARDDGYFVVEGNPTSDSIIERMRLEEARILILALNDAFSRRLLTERARAINPHLEVVGIATSAEESARLNASGMTEPVVAEREIALELGRYALHRFGVPSQQVARIIQQARARLR
jgi:CPA2 family monovalent cation:H+ antiporter-2